MKSLLLALVLLSCSTSIYAWPVWLRNGCLYLFQAERYRIEQNQISERSKTLQELRELAGYPNTAAVHLERIFKLAKYDDRVARDLFVKVEAYHQLLRIVNAVNTIEESVAGNIAMLAAETEVAILKAFAPENPDFKEFEALRENILPKLPKTLPNKKDRVVLEHLRKLLTYQDYVNEKILGYNDFHQPIYDGDYVYPLGERREQENREREERNNYIDGIWKQMYLSQREKTIVQPLRDSVARIEQALRGLFNPDGVEVYVKLIAEENSLPAGTSWITPSFTEEEAALKLRVLGLLTNKKDVMKFLYGGTTLNSSFEEVWAKVEAAKRKQP